MAQKNTETFFDETLLRQAKRRAADQSWTLNELIQEAVAKYRTSASVNTPARENAYHAFCNAPIRLTQKQIKVMLRSDAWAE